MTAKSPLAEACSSRPFSNGTEGGAWMSKWCELCVHDHKMHGRNPEGPGCELICAAMLGMPSKEHPWPEAWLPEPDDGEFHLPSRLVCLRFQACTEDDCEGDPGAEARAERVADVIDYWRQRSTEVVA